ncbi:MAG TPA: hypothetical protein DCY79_00200 [Planctomycetaceae bacterium]|nr:hypothetical protein [Blastopirellula sp.]HAY78205.1 hypothetical protein [Planctomycetaceae bacterium]
MNTQKLLSVVLIVFSLSLWVGLLNLTVALLSMLGTTESEIVVQQAPKYQTVFAANHQSSLDSTDSSDVPETDRMLGAIVPRGARTWFFKLAGPKDAVGAQRESLLRFLGSVRFGSASPDIPTWVLPTGWRQVPGSSGMRFATIQIVGEGGPLELSVIPLPTTGGSPVEAILANVNRWRGQLQLGKINAQQLEDETEQIEVAGSAATLIDYVGQLDTSSMRPPFAGGRPGIPQRPRPPRPAPTEPITYDVPAGWQKGQASSLGHDAYVVSGSDGAAKITVTRLGPSPILDNVNRWRGQVGLANLTPAELEDQVEEIVANGKPVQFTQSVGERETILGGILLDSGTAWFFKLRGPNGVSAEQTDNFRAFLQSIKL